MPAAYARVKPFTCLFAAEQRTIGRVRSGRRSLPVLRQPGHSVCSGKHAKAEHFWSPTAAVVQVIMQRFSHFCVDRSPIPSYSIKLTGVYRVAGFRWAVRHRSCGVQHHSSGR